MADELVNAIAESLPDNVSVESLPADVNQDVKAESSPAAPVETPTPKVEPKEPPFHEHPRWKERQREVEELRLQNQKLISLLETKTVPPSKDPLDDLPQEERQAWERVRALARAEAKSVAEAEKQAIRAELQEQKILATSLIYERFQEKHPDIKSGSDEEGQIAQMVNKGYSLEDAYRLVTEPRRLKEAQDAVEAKYRHKIQQKTTEKAAANLEGPGIPGSSPIQPGKKETTADIVDRWLKAGGGG